MVREYNGVRGVFETGAERRMRSLETDEDRLKMVYSGVNASGQRAQG